MPSSPVHVLEQCVLVRPCVPPAKAAPKIVFLCIATGTIDALARAGGDVVIDNPMARKLVAELRVLLLAAQPVP